MSMLWLFRKDHLNYKQNKHVFFVCLLTFPTLGYVLAVWAGNSEPKRTEGRSRTQNEHLMLIVQNVTANMELSKWIKNTKKSHEIQICWGRQSGKI